jgi:hypothetical protein
MSEQATAQVERVEPKLAPKKSTPNFAGMYRVREGYRVTHGKRDGDGDGVVGKHGETIGGKMVKLTHDEALSILRLHQQAVKAGRVARADAPPIETEEAYEARVEAEKLKNEMLEMLASDPVLE